MRRLLSSVALIATLVSASAFAEKYRVGTEGVYPPWNFQNQAGELTGFEIDLVNEIAAITGDEIEYVTMDFDALIPNLNAGRIDFFLSGMTINNERKQSIDFTTAYAEIPNQFVAKDIDPATVENYDDLLAYLNGKVIGAQAGTLHGVWVEEVLGNKAELRNYRTAEELAADVDAGRVDTGFAEQAVWQGYLNEHKDAFVAFGPALGSADDPQLFGEGIGMGIRKGESELKAKLDNALDELRANGKLKDLTVEYFGFDASR
ncbi:MAG: substrate-binding periplasmic protein [Alphaproteobacteria bacterium]